MKTSTIIITLASGILVAGALVLLSKDREEENLDHLYFDDENEKVLIQKKGINANEYNSDNLFI